MTTLKNSRYIVAGSRPWSRSIFEKQILGLPGDWQFAGTVAELSAKLTVEPVPRYVFFLHWSARVPDEWLERFECVCFHMTDVPYGRGGSPLQNLIVRGHRETQLSALRMVRELDAGPVYLKQPLNLGGNAEEIYLRAGHLSAAMIARIATEEPKPVPQLGEPTLFKRRKPEQSAIPTELPDLGSVHDFIRMLDAETYPHAFISYGGFRLEFRRASLYDGRIVAEVTITELESPAL